MLVRVALEIGRSVFKSRLRPWPTVSVSLWESVRFAFDLLDPQFPDLQNGNVKTPSLTGGLSHKTKPGRHSI